ncbi:MAG: exosortase A, partial [Sphingopyxis sp.]
MRPRSWPLGLAWVGAGAVVWALGDAASVALLRQIGLIMMMQGCVPALFGPALARALIFPIGYSFFLVPLGEELVPPMQLLTAEMTMALLRLTGVPAYVDGIFITTPSGHFAVAAACSGVKFLVAMAALAVLAAHLCFQSARRRLAFLAFALIVPVLANGVRAFGTVWMAEHWGTDFAAGADHVIYGWFFFAIVIALIGWAASPWFDRDADDNPVDGAALAGFWPGRAAPMAMVGAAVLALGAAPLAWGAWGAARGAPVAAYTPPAIAGWVVDDGTPPQVAWRPRFDGADHMDCTPYRPATANDGASTLTLCVAAYARQSEGHEIVGYGQGAADPDSMWRWGESLDPIGAARVDRLVADEQMRDALTVYAVGGQITASAARVKWLALRARLLGGDERAYAIILSAPPVGDQPGRAMVEQFVRAGGGINAIVHGLTAQR